MVTRIAGTVVATALLAACTSVDITLNDALIYEPPRLFRDFAVSDPHLKSCIQQQIEDRRITAAEGLTDLNCSSAGITSIDGLATFTGLQRLKLSDNRILNLVELGQLTGLVGLWLDGNRIVDPVPLAALDNLAELDLSDNSNLQCPGAGAFPDIEHLTLPEHCQPR